jgi:putative hydrolase of the HAD superfamily
MNWRAIVFDLDQTLVDRDEAWLRFFSECGLNPAQQKKAAMLDASGYAPREEVCTFVAEMMPRHFSDAHAVWQKARCRIPQLTRPYEKAPELIASLRQRVPVGILTNGGLGQYEKARRLGPVDVIRVSGDMGLEKPDPRAFHEVLGALGTSPGETCFVGDNPTTDILGAQKAGLPTIWISHGRHWGEAFLPDLSVPDVNGLGSVLS